MDIADLLQLQRALQGHGIVPSTTEVEEVGGIGIGAGQLFDAVVLLEQLVDLVGNLTQFFRQADKLIVADGTLRVGECQSEQRQTGELTGEGFCRSHTDLGSYMDVDSRVGLACDTGTDGVDDTKDKRATLLGQLDGSQRVGGLTTLRDGDDHVGRQYHGVAITELRGIVHLHGYLAIVLDELLADESSVPARTTGHNDEAGGGEQTGAVVAHGRKDDLVVEEAAAHAVTQTTRLVKDLLEHEMGEAATVEHVEIHIDLLDADIDLFVFQVDDLQFLARLAYSDLLIIEVHDVLRVACDWRSV